MAHNDAFGRHELMDRAHIVAETFDAYCLEHGWVDEVPELSAEAKAISERLHDFYQLVGRHVYERVEKETP